MKVTFSIDDGLLAEILKITVVRNTTLAAMVRAYLEDLVRLERERRNIEALERSFERLQFRVEKNWKREDLYDRR